MANMGGGAARPRPAGAPVANVNAVRPLREELLVLAFDQALTMEYDRRGYDVDVERMANAAHDAVDAVMREAIRRDDLEVAKMIRRGVGEVESKVAERRWKDGYALVAALIRRVRAESK